MKKSISLCLLVCVTLGLFASCGQTDLLAQTTAEKTQLSAAEATGWASEEITGAAETTDEETTEEETTEEKTTEEKTTEEGTTAAPLVLTSTVPFNPADRLEPTQQDFDRLEGLLYWGSFDSEDYDSDHDRILDMISNAGTITAGMSVYDLLREGENYGYIDGMDGDLMHIGRDPRHYASEYGGYKKTRADVMEYYLENVFHNFSYPDAREGNGSYTDNEGEEHTYWMYYYEDGWYYFNFDARDDDTALQVREYETKSNGHYLLILDRVSVFDPDFIEATFQVDATLIQKDGRRLWTIYSTKVLYNRYAELSNQ